MIIHKTPVRLRYSSYHSLNTFISNSKQMSLELLSEWHQRFRGPYVHEKFISFSGTSNGKRSFAAFVITELIPSLLQLAEQGVNIAKGVLYIAIAALDIAKGVVHTARLAVYAAQGVLKAAEVLIAESRHLLDVGKVAIDVAIVIVDKSRYMSKI